MNLTQQIHHQLDTTFAPQHLDVIDQSHLHAGHQAVKEGAGSHYAVIIVSEQFIDQSRVKRHRQVYKAVEELMRGQIHALAVQALTPEEWQLRQNA